MFQLTEEEWTHHMWSQFVTTYLTNGNPSPKRKYAVTICDRISSKTK